MAAISVLPAMRADSEKNVHPFFSRGNGASTADKPSFRDAVPASKGSGPSVTQGVHTTHTKPRRTASKRNPKNELADGKQKTQRTLNQVDHLEGRAEQHAVIEICPSEPNGDDGRQKRRKTGQHGSIAPSSDDAPIEPSSNDASIEPSSNDAQPAAVQAELSRPVRRVRCRSSPQVLIPRPSTVPIPDLPVVELSESVKPVSVPGPGPALPSTPPKKLLRLNSNGTFSSPPSKKPKDQPDPEREATKRRGRPRRAAAAQTKQELLVKVSYGSDDESRALLAENISRILGGEERIELAAAQDGLSPPRIATRTRKVTSRPDGTPEKAAPKKAPPQKPPHPFFNREKPTKKPEPTPESPRKTSAVTPGKLRMQAMAERPSGPRDSQPFGSALLRDRLMIRHPGAKEAPFPDREQAHVRGAEPNHVKQHVNDDTFAMLFSYRKRKQARLPLPPQESILYQYAAMLEPEPARIERSDGFYEPNHRLTIPTRLILSGDEIAQSVSRELSVSLADDNADELGSTFSRACAHPALQRLYTRLPSILTAFDESKGETTTWTQKHAPSSSSDVLQPENEMGILKDWLKSLTVQATGGGALPAKGSSSESVEKPKRKRKKKFDEMDDFLVDSDGDMHEMSEVTNEASTSPMASRKALKSMVQVAGEGAKLSNAVLLSGPHGCGKTAAAYAVAKELGFKVFEISSSERRSGKDVLDKIGNMTENHLVRHHGSEVADISEAEEPSHMDEAFQKDLQSGRQEKMSAFFKGAGNPNTKPPEYEPKKMVKEKTLKAVVDAPKKQGKDPQQSLVLLEEVDVLFKDDKDFWTTILKLIVTSKRPFIMTCNDEDLVPLQAISLHAILRFRQPPLGLATDYMLLVAAAEGHLLKRNAVASLYRRHNFDLRASMTELDYWCQMSVGDPREGLSWIFQRWPHGSDRDANGRKLRLVSDGTYAGHMGLAPAHDPTSEDALWWTWTEFGVAPAEALGWKPEDEAGQQADGLRPPIAASPNWSALRRQQQLAEALSAADACTAHGLPDSRPFDATCPEMPDKARSHYTEGMALLQTDELADHAHTAGHLAVAMTLSAYRSYGEADQALQPTCILARIPESSREAGLPMTRHAFSCFDAISAPTEISLMNPGLQQSAFDGPLTVVSLDLAPYVRSIVQHDQALDEQRQRLDLLSSDGRQAHKRARTTRAARSALEGSQRSTTRRERWFTQDLDVQDRWRPFTAVAP